MYKSNYPEGILDTIRMWISKGITDDEIGCYLAKDLPGHSYEERKRMLASAHQPNVRLITFMKPSEIRSYEPPEGSVLVGENHIVKGEIFVIGGAPGVGKSRASVAMAQAGATGKPWFGLEVHRQFKTMILQNENGKHRLKLEVSDIPHDMEDHVRICPPPEYGFQFESELFKEQLAEAIEEFQPDVFLLDPWNAVARRTTQEDYLAALQAIQSVMPAGNDKPAIGIIAHTRKPKQEERHSGRALLNLLAGSYILGSVPRTVWILQAASDAGEDSRVVWTCCKNNDGDLGARSAWVRRNGLFQPLSDFDWTSFDGDGVQKYSWQDVPAIVRDGACGSIAKNVAIERLKAKGISQPTAYRWLEKALAAGHLQSRDGYISL
jgi:hypothetical protein